MDRIKRACGPPVRDALWWLMMGVLTSSGVAYAQQTPPEPTPEELKEIEKALAVDTKEQATKSSSTDETQGSTVQPAATSLNLALSLVANFALAVFSQEENLQMGAHDPTHTGFNLQGLELSAGADVDPYFEFNANIVFGEAVEIEEVYATTLALPGNFQLRAGQFLTAFGRINAQHLHSWDMVDQPLVIGKMLGPDGNRNLGVELSWLSPLPWYVELVASVTEATGDCCARSFYGDDDRGLHSLLDLETTLALKQFHALSDNWSLATGLSTAIGPNPSAPDAQTYLFGADVYLKYRPITYQSSTVVSLQAEALSRTRETPEGLLRDTGFYGQLFYRFAQRWAMAGRWDYVTGVVNDPLDPDWVSERHRATANVTFYPTEFSRLRLQGSVDLPSYVNKPIYAGFLALEVGVGDHAAHKF